MEVGAPGVRMTSSVVLQTAADGQLFELAADPVSDVHVLTAALPLPLNTHLQLAQTHRWTMAKQGGRPHRSRHDAGGVSMAAPVLPRDTGVNG